MDTIIVPLSDMHSGGTTALFPDRFWQFQHGNHTPTQEQRDMFAHFRYCAEQIRQARKRKKLVVIHAGDATEGTHHGTLQIVTSLEKEQIEIHCELMDFFLSAVDFGKGDELYYIRGTEVHTNDSENVIGKDLGAVMNGEYYAFDELKIEINKKRFWITHRGPASGRGANKGNSFRNWLRDMFYECVNESLPPPHYIITGHAHDPYWQSYHGRYEGAYHQVQGLICPSWQIKTRYGYAVAPLSLNKIGVQYVQSYKGGHIGSPVEMLM